MVPGKGTGGCEDLRGDDGMHADAWRLLIPPHPATREHWVYHTQWPLYQSHTIVTFTVFLIRKRYQARNRKTKQVISNPLVPVFHLKEFESGSVRLLCKVCE